MSTAEEGAVGSPVHETVNKETERSEFVVVTDAAGEILEVPTNTDNSLNMATLQAAVSGATGLKYKNPKTGATRTVLVDSSGTKLLPPTDGWEDKSFQVILPVVEKSGRGADVSVKRRKMDDSDDEEDSENEGRLGRKRAPESNPIVRPVDMVVLGISYKTTDEGFKEYFETFGSVVFAEIKRNQEGTSKGFGFVQMTNLEDQEKILKLKEHNLDGRKIEVKLPDQRSHWDYVSQTPIGKRMSRESINKVFVGRLIDRVTDTMLREFFEKECKKHDESCTVTDVFLPQPFRGFGFVTFSSSDVAEKICKQLNYVVDNVSVVVRLAVPKDSHSHNNTPVYQNQQGYEYGYGGGRGGFGDYGRHEQKGYSQGGYDSPRGYGGPQGGGWGGPQSTPARGGPLTNNRVSRPNRRSAASPAFSAGGIPPPSQPPQPLIPDQQNYNMVPNQIANGIDALNLNHKNPELINAAWSAFYNTLNHSGHAGMSPRAPPGHIPYPPPQQHQQQHQGWQQ